MRNDPCLNGIYPGSHGDREDRETGETEKFLNVRDRQPRPSQLAICDFSLSTRQRSQFPHLVAWPLGHLATLGISKPSGTPRRPSSDSTTTLAQLRTWALCWKRMREELIGLVIEVGKMTLESDFRP